MGVGIIYRITNTKTGKAYIGQTVGSLEQRWSVHIALSTRTKSYLYNAMRRHGLGCFVPDVIACSLNEQALDELERTAIKDFATAAPKGYNIYLGGKRDRKASAFGKRRNAKAQRGRRHSTETRKKQSQAALGRAKAPTHHDPIRKPVLCIETGLCYIGLSSAARAMNLRVQDICNQLKGRQRTVKGHQFIYKKGP